MRDPARAVLSPEQEHETATLARAGNFATRQRQQAWMIWLPVHVMRDLNPVLKARKRLESQPG